MGVDQVDNGDGSSHENTEDTGHHHKPVAPTKIKHQDRLLEPDVKRPGGEELEVDEVTEEKIDDMLSTIQKLMEDVGKLKETLTELGDSEEKRLSGLRQEREDLTKELHDTRRVVSIDFRFVYFTNFRLFCYCFLTKVRLSSKTNR